MHVYRKVSLLKFKGTYSQVIMHKIAAYVIDLPFVKSGILRAEEVLLVCKEQGSVNELVWGRVGN